MESKKPALAKLSKSCVCLTFLLKFSLNNYPGVRPLSKYSDEEAIPVRENRKEDPFITSRATYYWPIQGLVVGLCCLGSILLT